MTSTRAGADAIDLLMDLIRIDSVNPGLVPGAAGEARIVDFLRDRLSRNGFTTEVIEAHGVTGRPSLLAWPPDLPASAGPVVLQGHLDTVGVAGMQEPFTPRVVGERLYGRGACDMLGGIAAIVVAAQEARKRGAPVVLALVADEEDRSLGSEAVLAALPGLGIAPRVCLVAEPTWLATCTSLRGYAVAEVLMHGRAAHTSLPGEGLNALSHAVALVTRIDQHAKEIRARGGEFLVSVLQAGQAPFTIPDSARMLVERRTLPGEAADVIVSEVRRLIDDLRADGLPDLDATVRLQIARPAWRLERSGPARAMALALADALRAPVARRHRTSPPPTGWRPRCGSSTAYRPWCAAPRAVACTRSRSGWS